jgi:hypothetical protein
MQKQIANETNQKKKLITDKLEDIHKNKMPLSEIYNDPQFKEIFEENTEMLTPVNLDQDLVEVF